MRDRAGVMSVLSLFGRYKCSEEIDMSSAGFLACFKARSFKRAKIPCYSLTGSHKFPIVQAGQGVSREDISGGEVCACCKLGARMSARLPKLQLKRSQLGVRLVSRCAAATLFVAMSLFADAAAGQSHVYDPVLSLRGSCTTTAQDPIPDPGPCPGNPGIDHPSKGFNRPCGTATDRHGSIYVATVITEAGSIKGGHVDVFNAQGEFLTEFEDVGHAPCGMAVDAQCNVYTGGVESNTINVYKSSECPLTKTTKFGLIREISAGPGACPETRSLAVDPENDHLYVGRGICGIREHNSAAEGSLFIREIPLPPGVSGISGIDVRGQDHDIYIAGPIRGPGDEQEPSRFLVLDGATGEIECEVRSTQGPGGLEDLDFGLGAALAVNQANGDAYVYAVDKKVYRFAVPDEDGCEFVDFLPEPFPIGVEPLGDIAVDAPMQPGESGYKSPNEGYVFVTSGRLASNSHLFAFQPNQGPNHPEIDDQAANGISESEAVLKAKLKSGSLAASYRFEYTAQAEFDESGYVGANSAPIPEGTVEPNAAFVEVSAPIVGLSPDTTYRFRLIASNCAEEGADPEDCETIGEDKPGEEGTDASFSTYVEQPIVAPCPNESFRISHSATLPDCRAYELVTPPDTGGHFPTMRLMGELGYADFDFETPLVTPDGGSVLFSSATGALPGIGGGGRYDTFEASRGADGWHTQFTGMFWAEAERPFFGGFSADHRCSFWNAEQGKGELIGLGGVSVYLRCLSSAKPSPNCAVEENPAGRFEWLACGSLGFDRQSAGKWITPGGDHVIFMTGSGGLPGATDPVQLEECAPPTGIRAIYDRTPGEPTLCVSVPPAGASTETLEQFEEEDPIWGGVSEDGSAVAFEVAGTLYARLDNTTTVEIASGKTAFAGFSADGRRAFYVDEPTEGKVRRGQIYMCEIALGPCGPAPAQAPTQIGAGGESAIVNVSANGSHVYFTSPKLLDGGAGEEGKDNLYLWDGSAVHFIAVLDPSDMDGNNPDVQGLGLWVGRVIASTSAGTSASIGAAFDPSRTTPDGRVLVFQSHAELTGQEANGHWQLFRYALGAALGEQLTCLSCNPTGVAANSDAELHDLDGEPLSDLPPAGPTARIPNVTADGQKVFFQSTDRLVAADADGKLDVYEWEADGVGGCKRQDGCLALISAPQSIADEYLYAMTPDGHDVFFFSGDLLAGGDVDATPSIYDAREGGGFPEPEPPPEPCLGEACQPRVVAPEDPVLGTHAQGDPKPKRGRCPAAKRKGKGHRGEKARCVKKPKKQGKGRQDTHRDPRSAR